LTVTIFSWQGFGVFSYASKLQREKDFFFEENGKWIYKHVEVDFDGAIPINYKI